KAQNETAVVIGVFAEEVDACGGGPHPLGCVTECGDERGRGGVQGSCLDGRGLLGGAGQGPGVGDDLVAAAAGCPAEFFTGAVVRGDEESGIPRTAGAGHDGHGSAGDSANRLDHLANAVSTTGTEVVHPVGTRGDAFQGAQVRIGQIGDVQIIAYGGAVRGGVIGAVQGGVWTFPVRHTQQVRYQVGLGVVAFTETEVGACDDEVAQADGAEPVGV